MKAFPVVQAELRLSFFFGAARPNKFEVEKLDVAIRYKTLASANIRNFRGWPTQFRRTICRGLKQWIVPHSTNPPATSDLCSPGAAHPRQSSANRT